MMHAQVRWVAHREEGVQLVQFAIVESRLVPVVSIGPLQPSCPQAVVHLAQLLQHESAEAGCARHVSHCVGPAQVEEGLRFGEQRWVAGCWQVAEYAA